MTEKNWALVILSLLLLFWLFALAPLRIADKSACSRVKIFACERYGVCLPR